MTETETVHLTELHPAGHEELFEHHSVLATLPGGHTHSTGPQTLPIVPTSVSPTMLHSHWSEVQQCSALIGRDLQSVAFHKEPARRIQNAIILAGSLWHKSAFKRTFPCMEANYPYVS